MHLLLDTHTLIWWLANNPISITAKGAIANPDNLVFVSAASAWEIAIKKSLGKLQAPDDLQKQIEREGRAGNPRIPNRVVEETRFRPLAINIDHALALEHLPYYHQDPFKRILIAQAIYEQLTIVTRDRIFKSYDVAIIQS